MKVKKMSFADIEETMCKEEMKCIMGGSGSDWGSYGGYGGPGNPMQLNTVVIGGGSSSQQNFYSGAPSSWSGYSSVSTNNNYDQNYYGNYGSSYNGNYYGGGSGITASSTTNQQPGPTDCFFQCLGWISTMYGDQAHDAKYYANIYAFVNPNHATNTLYNFLTATGVGIIQSQALSFAGNFFAATDYSGASTQFLSKFINPATNPSGDNQLIGVYRTSSGGLHAVNITSIDGNRVNFYDPQKAKEGSVTISEMVSFYGIKAR
ncbi:hypothetical protein BXU11_03795 [Flavobacterium sp. LM5]|uniref:hypothetical protein n=1 Tax=Flavobacterium sp. LM5 TaxID=1938610 RepID=UPI0009928472|nr:hypothetical protein [Flavobacterium sp. LM5]OOV29061.1 hypothetical protein BXU11_03795 [Flavobacterium sp. LM5]